MLDIDDAILVLILVGVGWYYSDTDTAAAVCVATAMTMMMMKIFMGGDTRSHEIFCDIFAIFADLCDLSHLEVTSDTSP